MEQIAELLDVSAAEVLGTASFYEMFKRHHVGRYLVTMGSVKSESELIELVNWLVAKEAG